MCGIIGYLGNKPCIDKVILGLKQLQNRGYDSAGIGGIVNGKLVVSKYATTLKSDSIIRLQTDATMFSSCSNMIGHTRWATHGAKTDANSHPHSNLTNSITVVHNGMIENYQELKTELETQHFIKFKSQTDTEVITHLISVCYDNTVDNFGIKHMEQAIMSAVSRIKGTWALVIICEDKPDNMYCVRHGSPLLIGIGHEGTMVASEQSGFCGEVFNYICLNNNDLTVMRRRNQAVSIQNITNYKLMEISNARHELTPGDFPHWTLKEIHEQYESSIRAISFGGRLTECGKVVLGGPLHFETEMKEIEHVILLGCGTSLNAANHSVDFFYDLGDFQTVQTFDGPSFKPEHIPTKGKTAIIFISQSGETKDLYRCMQIGKERECFLMGIVNVVDSLIAREVDCGCYLNAGREVGVASTKAFTSQVILLAMVSIYFAQIKGIHKKKRYSYVSGLRHLPQNIKQTIEHTKISSEQVAEYLLRQQHCFVLGKGGLFSVAQEGSLKIKEIGYIHAEAYEGNALRHGPYALLEEGTPILFLNPQDNHFADMNNTTEEISSRGAVAITITSAPSNKVSSKNKFTINVPDNSIFQGILHNIPMQLIAYYLGVKKGINVDQPRNLAKSVTV
jgi:glucosamine--fructose-6-phosphate aminotransferase (isomerizing)